MATVAEIEKTLAEAQANLAQAYKDFEKVDKKDIKAIVTLGGTISELEGMDGKAGRITKLEKQLQSAKMEERSSEREAAVADIRESLKSYSAKLKALNTEYGLKRIVIDLESTEPMVSITGGSTNRSTGPRAPRSSANHPDIANGTVLSHKFQSGETVSVTKVADGFQLEDGSVKPSISAAAKVLNKGTSTNGWTFFGIN